MKQHNENRSTNRSDFQDENITFDINPVSSELAAAKQMLYDSLQHTNPLLNQVLTIVRARMGKMMRPKLVLLAAKLFGDLNRNAVAVAAGYEAFHTASLIHDDVVDESEERRGQESINSSQSNRIAILVGDYILGIGLRFLASTNQPNLVDVMARSAHDLTDGELLQLYNIQNQIVSEETYYKIITNKTAALFAACAKSGAMIANASEEDVENLYLFGEKVGICFQIKDDIFDYEKRDIGKPIGNDMKEGKLTLPIIYALQHSPHNMDELVSHVKQCKATEEEVGQLIQLAHEQGGIDYAVRKMQQLADEAKQLLERYPDSSVKASLCDYVDQVINRKY